MEKFSAIKEFFLSWGMLVLSVVFNVYGIFVIKLRMNELGKIELNSPKAILTYLLLLLHSKLAASGIILFFLAPFVFAVAFSRMEVTVAYPVLVLLNFLFLVILAVLFLGETMTLNKAIAILLAFVSIYLLSK
ncbi:MAG: hypothetical protein WBC74_05845 [Candidatus Omnitrophota bacterium]